MCKLFRNMDDEYKWKQTDFYETVEMSTYLVALVISDFVCIKSVAHPDLSKSVDVGVCARPEFSNQLEYALNASVKIIEFFESFYNVQYPLPKSGNLNKKIFSKNI